MKDRQKVSWSRAAAHGEGEIKKIHELKSWPQCFSRILDGSRRHELRKNDRGFGVGNLLNLREYLVDSGEYTGRECVVEITDLVDSEQPCAAFGTAVSPDYCILSIRLVTSRQ